MISERRLIVPFMARDLWHQQQRVDRMKKGLITYTNEIIEMNKVDQADKDAKDTHARRQREYARRKK